MTQTSTPNHIWTGCMRIRSIYSNCHELMPITDYGGCFLANWLPVIFSLNCRKDARSERPPQREGRERERRDKDRGKDKDKEEVIGDARASSPRIPLSYLSASRIYFAHCTDRKPLFHFFPLVTCRFEAVLSPWSFGSQVGQLPLSRHLEPVESCTCRLPGGP